MRRLLFLKALIEGGEERQSVDKLDKSESLLLPTTEKKAQLRKKDLFDIFQL